MWMHRWVWPFSPSLLNKRSQANGSAATIGTMQKLGWLWCSIKNRFRHGILNYRQKTTRSFFYKIISPVTLFQMVSRTSMLRISSQISLHMSSQWTRGSSDASKLITMQNTFNVPLTITRKGSLPQKSTILTNSKQCGLQMWPGTRWTWLQSEIAGRRLLFSPLLLLYQLPIRASLSYPSSIATTPMVSVTNFSLSFHLYHYASWSRSAVCYASHSCCLFIDHDSHQLISSHCTYI